MSHGFINCGLMNHDQWTMISELWSENHALETKLWKPWSEDRNLKYIVWKP